MKLKNLVDVFKNLFVKDKIETKTMESLQARIIVSELSYNNSVVIVDENGESHTAPIPDPVEEEFIVKQGDRVNGFEVLEIIANFIELKSIAEYTTGNDSTPRTHFIIEKGECIHLNMCGVYDEVQKISIRFIETVEQSEEDRDMDRGDRRDGEYIATKDDWDITPMPEKNTRFTIKRKFSDAEINSLKKGHVPLEMEDRWFYYYEDGKVYFHRSWTGTCIYIVKFDFKTNKHIVTVNRDENQYSNTDMQEDIESINYLLSV